MGENKEHSQGFVPAQIRDLTLRGHLLFLFCALFNLYVGFVYFAPLANNDASDSDDHMCLRDAAERDTYGEIFDPFLTTGNESLDSSYLPVQGVVYHWSVNVFEERLIPVRVMGIVFHVLNGLLLMILAFRFTRSIPVAQMVALIFLFHPRVVGAQSWLSASVAHGIVLFFYLSAFLILQTFLHKRGWWRLPIGVISFALAVLTKELATTLFGVLIVYDALVATGLRKLWRPKLKVWAAFVARHSLTFAVVVGAIIMQRLKYSEGFINNSFGGVEIGLRCPIRLFELLTLTFYWWGGWDRVQLLWALGGVAAALMVGAYLARRNPVYLFFVLWMPLVMTPYTISNFRNAGQLGRYTYEVLAVMAIFLGVLAAGAIKKWPQLKWPLLVSAGAMLVAFLNNATRVLQ